MASKDLLDLYTDQGEDVADAPDAPAAQRDWEALLATPLFVTQMGIASSGQTRALAFGLRAKMSTNTASSAMTSP